MPKITFKDKQGSIIETIDVPADTSVMEVPQDFILANNTLPNGIDVCGGRCYLWNLSCIRR